MQGLPDAILAPLHGPVDRSADGRTATVAGRLVDLLDDVRHLRVCWRLYDDGNRLQTHEMCFLVMGIYFLIQAAGFVALDLLMCEIKAAR